MKRFMGKVILAALTIALVATSAYAEHLFGPDELDTTYGAAIRLRQETWDNVFDLSDAGNDDNLFRLKTSIWAKLDYDNKKYGFVAKLTNEARYFMDTSNEGSRPSGLNEDEIVFDNLYVYATDIGGLPVDVSIGRQDFLMKYGEGFLIMDGTPFDGSRTFYFNAARVAIKFNPKITVDLVYTTNPETDKYLSGLFPGEKRKINYSDETGAWVYAKMKPMDNLSLDAYYIYKNEETPKFFAGELDLHTFGGRAVYGFGNGMSVRGEFAYQTGEYDDAGSTDREGYGGYAYLTKSYKEAKFSPKIDLGFVYLSGDDTSTTGKDEGFNPLFAGWPKWSELFIFTLAPERDIAYWTNFIMVGPKVSLKLNDKAGCWFSYNYLLADEDNTLSPAPFYSRDDDQRGHLYQALGSYKFTDKIDGYVRVEYLDTGDFYANDDDAMFTRWQLQFKL